MRTARLRFRFRYLVVAVSVLLTVVGLTQAVRHRGASGQGQAGQAAGGTVQAAARSWWKPPMGRLAWQWELDHPLDLGSAADMGTTARTFTGQPAAPPVVYDIDGFSNPAVTIRALHGRGYHAICYIEVGAAESYRPDYRQFPKAALGREVPGYPSERYLNIADPRVVKIIEARIAMCAKKGFDAIEPDIDDSYTDATGFAITRGGNVAYDSALATYAHSLGLGFGLKNGDDPAFAAALLPRVDFELDEQCFQYGTCGAFHPSFQRARKAVLEVEYFDQGGPPPAVFCPRANADGFDSVDLGAALAGKHRVTCF